MKTLEGEFSEGETIRVDLKEGKLAFSAT